MENSMSPEPSVERHGHTVYFDGTMDIKVDGIMERRRFSISVEDGRMSGTIFGRYSATMAIIPELKPGERLMQFFGRASEIITEQRWG